MPYINATANNAAGHGPYKATGANGTFSVQGTFDSATVDLQYVVPGGTLQKAYSAATTVTTATNQRFEAANGVDFYIVITGGGGSMDLEIFLSGAV